MKCNSCQTEIDPRWTHALNSNICPNCGDSIMPDNLKELLASLKETMQALQEYPQELNDWMLSNYSYIKTDSPDLVNYLPDETIKSLKSSQRDKEVQERKKSTTTIKVKNENGEIEEQEVEVEKIQSDDKATEFFKRAQSLIGKKIGSKPAANNASPASFGSAAEKTAHIKAMAERIKKEGSELLLPDADEEVFSPDTTERADPDTVAQLQMAIGGGEYIPAGPDDGLGDVSSDIRVPSHIASAMQSLAAKKNGGGQNSGEKDLAKIQERMNNPNASRLGAGCFGRS